jgi:hypothetical protein
MAPQSPTPHPETTVTARGPGNRRCPGRTHAEHRGARHSATTPANPQPAASASTRPVRRILWELTGRTAANPARHAPTPRRPGTAGSARSPADLCGLRRAPRGAVTRFKGTHAERLIGRTALGSQLHSRRSAQRFERDTYHGDALPTELRGRVLSCLTCDFAPAGGQPRSCTAVIPEPHQQHRKVGLGTPDLGEITALRQS